MTSLSNLHSVPIQYRMGDSFCVRYDQLYKHVEQIPDKLKHKITQFNHGANSNEHLFLPQHHITLGEYNLLYFLSFSDKRKKYQEKSVKKSEGETE